MLAFRSHIDEIAGLLGASVIQSLPTDDRIISEHIREALAIAKVIQREMTAARAPDLLVIAKRAAALDFKASTTNANVAFVDVRDLEALKADARDAIAKVERA